MINNYATNDAKYEAGKWVYKRQDIKIEQTRDIKIVRSLIGSRISLYVDKLLKAKGTNQ